MANITIEKASITDLAEVQKLNQALCAKENKEFDEKIDPNFPYTKAGDEYFRSRMTSDDGITLVARESENVIGYLVGGIAVVENYRTVKVMAELENMYIEESFRGQGIGGQLAVRFENWCRDKGAERIRVIASAANTEAIKFYKKLGAEEVSLTLEKDLE